METVHRMQGRTDVKVEIVMELEKSTTAGPGHFSLLGVSAHVNRDYATQVLHAQV